MTARKPRVCLLAASRLDRQAFTLLVGRTLGWQVNTHAGYQPLQVGELLRNEPDLVIALDAFGAAPLERAINLIASAGGETRILLIECPFASRVRFARVGNGIHGYISRDCTPGQLGDAIRSVLAGGFVFKYPESPDVGGEPVTRPPALYDSLTPRECELAILLAQGYALRAAAQVMGVSRKTVDSYRTSLLRKLALRDRVELARFAIRGGLLDP